MANDHPAQFSESSGEFFSPAPDEHKKRKKMIIFACLIIFTCFFPALSAFPAQAQAAQTPTPTKTPHRAFTAPATGAVMTTAVPKEMPGMDAELKAVLGACFWGGLFVYFVIFALLAFAGWSARGKRTEELVYVPLAPLINPSASLLGFLLKLAYPAFLLALVLIVILAGILGGILQLLGKAIRAGVRSWIRRGTRIFDFAHSALQSIFDLNRQALRLIETLVTLLLTHHLIARQLALDNTLRLLSQLNLGHFLLEIFSSLACDGKQPLAQRLEAIQWIGKTIQFIPGGHYLTLRNTGDRLLEFTQDTSLPTKLRIMAARILSSYTYTAYPAKRPRKTQCFKRDFVIRAWQALAKDAHISSPLIRISAIRALHYQFHGHREAYAILTRMLETIPAGDHGEAEDELLVRAAWLLGQITSPQELDLASDRQKAIDYLRYYSNRLDCNAPIRYLASAALGQLGERDEAGVLLYRLACEAESGVRQRAIAALYRLRQQKWLVALANQKNWSAGQDLQVRLRAIEFLSHLDRNVSACLWLEIAFQAGLQTAERIQVAYRALQDGEPRARLILQQIGEGGEHTGPQRLLAAEALARCNYMEDARLVYMLLSHDVLQDRRVATQAIRELARLKR